MCRPGRSFTFASEQSLPSGPPSAQARVEFPKEKLHSHVPRPGALPPSEALLGSKASLCMGCVNPQQLPNEPAPQKCLGQLAPVPKSKIPQNRQVPELHSLQNGEGRITSVLAAFQRWRSSKQPQVKAGVSRMMRVVQEGWGQA